MMLHQPLRSAYNSFRERVLRARGASSFTCSVCLHIGPFLVFRGRPSAQCPRCGSLERHRLQALVNAQLMVDVSGKSLLHIAPEKFFRSSFGRMFGRYETADLERHDVDHKADLTALPFSDGSFDFVYASHVLEHVRDDAKAISEIRRVLRPGGIAILPVPIVAERTIEYVAPRPQESNHVRAPGRDYFDRYRKAFDRVELYESSAIDTDGRYALLENDCVPACHVQ